MKTRTRPGRLRALDAWLLHHEPQLSRGPLVDFGFGATADTTLEWARATGAHVIGIDRHPVEPVEGLDLRVGGFEQCEALSGIAIVRALNVLRGYRKEEVLPARARLGAPLREGGLLIDGSSDTEGHVLVAWLLRKQGGALRPEALLCHTDFTRGFSPWLFRDWLPRELRRDVREGTGLHALFTGWEARAGQAAAVTPQARFSASIAPPLLSSAWELERGFVRCPAAVVER